MLWPVWRLACSLTLYIRNLAVCQATKGDTAAQHAGNPYCELNSSYWDWARRAAACAGT